MAKYSIETVEDDALWDELVRLSAQGTVFSSSLYLRSCGVPFERIAVQKGSRTKALFSCLLSDDGRRIIMDDLVIYGGILFLPDDTQKEAKATAERFRISEKIIEFLNDRYDSMEFPLSPQFEDMRPFLWYNYHSDDDSQKYKLDLRYTSYVDISSLQNCEEENDSELFKGFETLRQRNIREAQKKGAYSKKTDDVELFIEFYRRLMIEQGVQSDEQKLQRMKDLIASLMDGDKAFLLTSRNSEGAIMYITIYCYDEKRAYYLFGAPNPEAQERYKGTISFWDGFKELAAMGIKEVDMEGINSPNRGWFKLSFGGSINPYYEVMI